MFYPKFCLALVTIALSSFIAQAAPLADAHCSSAAAVTHNVTIPDRAIRPSAESSSGSSSDVNDQNKTNKKGRGNNRGGNNNRNGKTNSTSVASTPSASITTIAAITGSTGTSGRGNKGRKGSGTRTSTSATATSTSAGGAGTTTNNSTNPQTSLTLNPKVIATGFENNGQSVPTPGQVASLTSSNNFINFCLTSNAPITNGKQITTGSCNPAPMGLIPSVDNMPSAKFVFPANLATIKANTNFTVQMAIQNMATGFFVNADENYFAAPQQLNGQGQIQGHSHVVVEQLSALDQTTPTNPRKFSFFKGLNGAARNGILTADVTGGLPAGFYKISSINTAANHQPVLVAVAQHGSLDDVVYFSVTADGNPASGSTGSSSNTSGSASSTSSSPSAPAKGSNPTKTAASPGSTATGKKNGTTPSGTGQGNAQQRSGSAKSGNSRTGNSKGRNGQGEETA